MGCREIDSWTLPTLVGAFLDLSLAHLLLCSSTLAFCASKFLTLFGLRLPCPCNGLFGNPGGTCLQGFLVNDPVQRISVVQRAVRSRFPFDSLRASGEDPVKMLGEDDSGGDGLKENNEEASCSSISCSRKSPSSVGGEKGVLNQKPGSGIRRRRRVVLEHERVSPFSSSGGIQLVDKGTEAGGPCSFSVDSIGEQVQYDAESHNSIPEGDELTPCMNGESLGPGNEKFEDKFSSFAMKRLQSSQSFGSSFDRNESNTVKILEEALREAQTARAALCVELEKERSAAASATDEAMGMILRLQKEKASIEMEATQYQRLMEEKSVYDEEEMNILKEILLRREREKLVLEKEVEMYRKMTIFGRKKDETAAAPSVKALDDLDDSQHLTDDPMLILRQISAYIACVFRENSLLADTATLGVNELEYSDKVSGLRSTSHGVSLCEVEPNFLDVHVIDDEYNTYDKESSKENASPGMCSILNTPNKQDHFSDTCTAGSIYDSGGHQNINKLEAGQNIQRSKSDATLRESSRGNALFSPLRSNSISAVDYEKLKLQQEVGRLTERLKVVQEGREKLSFSIEINERERFQGLQLLEEITSQLKEIRLLGQSGIAARRASLPSSTSKGSTKRRRCRSVSIHENAD